MRHVTTRGVALLLGCLLLAAAPVRADEELEPLDFKADTGNAASLQRGARDYMAYCSGCHSLKYLRYNRLGQDLGISDDLVKQNLIFGDAKIGEPILSAMPSQPERSGAPAKSEQWFGRVPPDLSLEAKAKGADWVYSYLMSFYLDSSRQFGVNNIYLPGVSMPAVLGELQGWQTMVTRTEEEKANGKVTSKQVFDHFETAQPGSMKPEEYKAFVTDLTNFLTYTSEPVQEERVSVGRNVMFYLVFLLLPLSYLLKKEFWRDVH